MLGLLMPLAGLLGLELDEVSKRVKGLAIGYAIIGIFGAIGVGFLIAAGYIALGNVYGPIAAALIMAGVFLAVALVVYVSMAIAENARRKRMAERRRSSDSGAFITTAALTALPLLSRSSVLVKLGIPAAALAALALMRNKDTPEA